MRKIKRQQQQQKSLKFLLFLFFFPVGTLGDGKEVAF